LLVLNANTMLIHLFVCVLLLVNGTVIVLDLSGSEFIYFNTKGDEGSNDKEKKGDKTRIMKN
jgi:hypothetical protein